VPTFDHAVRLRVVRGYADILYAVGFYEDLGLESVLRASVVDEVSAYTIATDDILIQKSSY
jgi:hypothetical protein